MCIKCSGIHRKVGIHYSKVRSATLDYLPPEIMALQISLGNAYVNSIMEEKLNGSEKISPDADMATREKFIRSKYVERLYVNKKTLNTNEERATLWGDFLKRILEILDKF